MKRLSAPVTDPDCLDRVEAALNQAVRPWLAMHGGGIEVVDTTAGTVRVRLLGHCLGCGAASLEISGFVSHELSSRVAEVTRVVLTDGVSDTLLAQARELLRTRGL